MFTGQGWLSSLEVENERLQGELDALRQRAILTPQHELRTKNERLTAQLREIERSDKTRAQLGFEVAQLKQELDKLRRSNGKNGSAALRRQVKVKLRAPSMAGQLLVIMVLFKRSWADLQICM